MTLITDWCVAVASALMTITGSGAPAAARLSSSEKLSGLRNGRGELEIPMTISGTLDAPSFSVNLAAVVRKGLTDELMRRLKRIIRD